jgi:predicted MFS family arabinose efflux permease
MTGAAASCAGLAAIPFAPADWLKMALLAIVMTLFGVCAAIVNTGNRIGFMEKTDRTQIARISGLMNAACAASIPFGTFITAGLSRRFSVAALFLGSGIAALITAVSFLFVKPLRKID